MLRLLESELGVSAAELFTSSIPLSATDAMGDSKFAAVRSTRSLTSTAHLVVDQSSSQAVLSVSMDTVIRVLFFLTLVSFTSCVVFSMLFNWDQSTDTHCHVPNYLPSISAAIGNYDPQKYIWRIGICFQISPRYLAAAVYLHHNLQQEFAYLDHVLYPLLCKVLFAGVLVEISCLALLTYVASVEWYFLHKLGFMGFLFFSVFNQFLHLLINRCSVRKMEDPFERSLFRRKILISATHVSSLAAALYFFWRHNAYCETGMYTFFAFFEYLVVLTNIAFHYVFVWDFESSCLKVVHRADLLKYSQA